MKNFLPLLCSTSLFNGLTPEELQTLLAQLGAVMRSYGKGEALVLAGEPNRRVGIVPVSFSHLTLPTKRIVEISGGGGSVKKKKKVKE